uniref:Uncharacterized protein n=2 Tax=Nicotiana TaxID=4085 RepID=A0A1S3YAX7_TOBAC|nr:PREDICTED: uncharacterized protein LOC104224206 [Nicotiana sylvestris]XP_016449406.1 PREDICTED: uncharacterized protein LOC107774401 [Nicotiana tabacum]
MNCGINTMIQVVCPKPRRVRHPICHSKLSNQAETLDSKAGIELFDLILKEDGVAAMRSASLLSSSPPFFTGSPPSRAMNPLIHDVYFANYGKQLTCTLSSSPSPSTSASPSPSSSCKGSSCARTRLKATQATNRVEGFDCQNSRLTAMV